MKNRRIFLREHALKIPAKKEVKAPVIDEAIEMLDIESGEVVETFSSLEEAIEKKELNRPNLIGAIKNGNKYKGFHWKKV